ncbi:MAG: hypothetical protein ACOVO1_13190 [Chitinophagaceae bacterium]
MSCNKTFNKDNNELKSTALNFDGINDQLIVPNDDNLQINNGTLEAWFKVKN